jgi:hypothetical protein
LPASPLAGASHSSAPGYDRTGALGPAAAYDPASFLDALAGHGVSYERPGAVPQPAAG